MVSKGKNVELEFSTNLLKVFSVAGMAELASLLYHISEKGTPHPLLILLSAVVICQVSEFYMVELMSKYALMAFIHHMVSAGFPKKSAGVLLLTWWG